MAREISAGGVVVRRREDAWWMAVIEPAGDAAPAVPSAQPAVRKGKVLLALPKGLVDPGEKALETAVREALRAGVPGDTVLLAPACASFDQFQDFEHRIGPKAVEIVAGVVMIVER